MLHYSKVKKDRDEVIEDLVEDSKKSEHFITLILKEGFLGYDKYDDEELIEEWNTNVGDYNNAELVEILHTNE